MHEVVMTDWIETYVLQKQVEVCPRALPRQR